MMKVDAVTALAMGLAIGRCHAVEFHRGAPPSNMIATPANPPAMVHALPLVDAIEFDQDHRDPITWLRFVTDAGKAHLGATLAELNGMSFEDARWRSGRVTIGGFGFRLSDG